MKKDTAKWLIGLQAIIISVSVFHFSFYCSPLLNSDSALGILMAEYLQLPNDLYCWGQDRGGNFIPVIARMITGISGLSLIISISIIHFAILILGYFSYSYFIRNNLLKLIFAICWFLPPWQFVEFLLYPYGIQYSILGMILYLAFQKPTMTSNLSKLILDLTVGVLATIGIWVSDYLIVSLVALFLTIIIKQSAFIRNPKTLFILGIWIVLTGSFISYAKSQSVPSENYLSNNLLHPDQLVQALSIVWQSIKRIFLFNSESGMQSYFWWLVILFTLILTLFKKPFLTASPNRSWQQRFLICFFTLNSIFSILAIMSSAWVLKNEMGRRYFSTLFISAVVLSIFILDQRKITRVGNVVLIILGVFSGLSSIENFYYPKKKTAKLDYIKQVNHLAPAGIIGDYWNSYVYSAADPVHLLSTPHDRSIYRNIALVEKVFMQPNIYLVKDMWMQEFPDTMHQFGRILIKDGSDFHLGDSAFCRYRLDSTYEHFHYRSMIPAKYTKLVDRNYLLDITKFHYNGYSSFDAASDVRQVLQLGPKNDHSHSKSAQTKVTLPPGNYQFQLSLRNETTVNQGTEFFQCTLTANQHQETHEIPLKEISSASFSIVSLPVKVSNPDNAITIELRSNMQNVYFDKLFIRKKE
ncbi:MAG: hypothetical protein KDC53_04395 [Saprospiraceae bacterium]|nr:hypothetical protein [Saprospiraceae bacterium]